jgi:PIN domain nuclease of toxin-antitoxin system
MRLLLDTNVFLWTLAGHERAEHLRGRILDVDNEVYVSSASYWELAIKVGIGKLDVNVCDLRQAARESGFIELPVNGAHAEYLAKLPPLHKDPFDRMLVSQAQSEPMRLLTSDGLLAGYGSNIEVV